MNETGILFSDYVGLPYERGAEGPDRYDCYGLVRALSLRRGYDLPARTSMASIDLRLALFEGRPSGFHRPVHLYEPFDLVVLDHCQFGLHIGMLTAEPDRFIHASPMAGKVIISRLRHPLYKDHIAGFARCTRSL